MAVGGCDRGCGVSGFLVGPVVGGGDSSMGVRCLGWSRGWGGSVRLVHGACG